MAITMYWIVKCQILKIYRNIIVLDIFWVQMQEVVVAAVVVVEVAVAAKDSSLSMNLCDWEGYDKKHVLHGKV